MKIASLKPTQWFPGQNVSVKPHLRGWIHLVAAPLSLAASIVLTCLAPTGATKGGSAIYLAASLILFGISALYHRFYWSCLLYTSPSPRDYAASRMPSSA